MSQKIHLHTFFYIWFIRNLCIKWGIFQKKKWIFFTFFSFAAEVCVWWYSKFLYIIMWPLGTFCNILWHIWCKTRIYRCPRNIRAWKNAHFLRFSLISNAYRIAAWYPNMNLGTSDPKGTSKLSIALSTMF